MSLAAWLIILAWIAIAVIFGVWVYGDARRRGEPALEWFLVVVLGSIAGVALYFTYRQQSREARMSTAGTPAPYPFTGEEGLSRTWAPHYPDTSYPPPQDDRAPTAPPLRQDPRTVPLPRCPRCGAATGFSDTLCRACGLPLR